MTDIALVQCNPTLGDLAGNSTMIIQTIRAILANTPDALIVFPEHALTGYPLDDLLENHAFLKSVDKHLQTIIQTIHQDCAPSVSVVIGCPYTTGEAIFNSAVIIQPGKQIQRYDKKILPNYDVFMEKRHYTSGNPHAACHLNHNNKLFSIRICEDLWHTPRLKEAKHVDAVISLNASPFHLGKHQARQEAMRSYANENKVPIFYANLVGGQDELVFDGGTMLVEPDRGITHQAAFFEEKIVLYHMNQHGEIHAKLNEAATQPSLNTLAYQALCCGLRDYANKNNITNAVLGLSGGIDSALSLAIAVDALGADRVTSVMLPSPYTLDMSLEDAAQQAAWLGNHHRVIPIDKLMAATELTLGDMISNNPKSLVKQNIQSRLRATCLMAIANEQDALLLSTSNKSELAVGYGTLYGDMSGGFAVLKDVSKTLVYALAEYRNSLSQAIPARVISRPPSAELYPGQCDTDSLPDYQRLDAIIESHIEAGHDLEALCKIFGNQDQVQKVLAMIHQNEFKRHQSPPGVKITRKAFGRNRPYPITNGYDYH